ncbi:citrate lyase subunit beta / citryl-CoA lyase/(S)-citramalyl-CoA lyase [Streptomyces sp. TLI_053]|uniref:HpcH/HpaI aldolase/citrate lyase family protein n=1 Tax=Streptomyces sp. TLI_053 TaxID=1855352 RepID=UPI00087C7C43|nr:CoA ester lyase [Streptomyces sp. TLI_053]SDT83424.1 citrate lyase subunit beta / citryl-CoA lyase/(S)-citramalyl-CoA lyase [Streptomyces sp. TLI_053]
MNAAVWLITPGCRPGRFAAVRSAGADIAVLDLEDSVPAELKDTARAAVLDHLANSATASAGVPLGLRMNAITTRDGLRDLLALADAPRLPDALLVPKIEDPRDTDLVTRHLRPGVRVWALIETPRAVQRLPEILAPGILAGVVFGAADYAAATGCARTPWALHHPRTAVAAACAAAGVPALDSPYFDLADTVGLRRESREARDLGFSGKGAVHPGQIAPIREAFAPDDAELARARALLAAAARTDAAVTATGGHMTGPPLLAAARATLARATHPADGDLQ